MKAVLASLQGERPAPVYVLVGDAAPLLERARAAVVEAALPRIGLPAFNHGVYRAHEASGTDAFNAARTLPMMADLRLVELRGLQDGDDRLFAALVDYCGDPCTSAVLVASGSRFPKVEKGGRNWAAKVRNAAKKGGLYASFQARDARPIPFARERAAELGKRLGHREAELLVDIAGTDLGRIDQELTKLALYIGDRDAIERADVIEACSQLAEAVIWDLTAGLATADPAKALGALHRLQKGGDDPRKLLGMISWQMRELLRLSDLVQRGASDSAIRKEVRVRGDVLRAVRPRMAAGRFPPAHVLLERLTRSNRDMNSHRAGADRIVERLVLSLLEDADALRPGAPP